ncbi:hypothetical protein E5288_WYG020622 [Bos mutus]|uniref:Uncharacterized protein n=1 Tax=Bos mutus TaxID=72004 RepID=A0A6B0R2Z1_9CETA|nr:hypothetical protein [Bos mutus]
MRYFCCLGEDGGTSTQEEQRVRCTGDIRKERSSELQLHTQLRLDMLMFTVRCALPGGDQQRREPKQRAELKIIQRSAHATDLTQKQP